MYPYLEIFGHTMQSYYVCAALSGIVGIVLSAIYLFKKKQGVWAVILPLVVAGFALIGARWLNYITNPGAFRVGIPVWAFAYRQLSLMGGLIAGVIVIMIYGVLKKESLPGLTDAFTVPAASGIILLKLGCFLNGCCHGKPTESPFGMTFPANEFKYRFINSLKAVSAKSPIVHPTQLYEIAGAFVAIAAAILLPRVWKMSEGSRAAIFIAVFSAARWAILLLRELPYDRQIVTTFYPCLYAAMICCSVCFLIKHGFTRKKQ